MAFGRSNRGVAAELDLSVKAVEKAVTRVVRKLGLNDEPLLDSRLSASLVYLRAQGGPGRRVEAPPLESGSSR